MEELQEPYISNIKTWIENNKDWEYNYVNSEQRRKHIEDYRPDLIELYDFRKDGIAQADIWRLVILEKFGGFYADIDSICQKNLNYIDFSNEITTISPGEGLDLYTNEIIKTVFANGFLGVSEQSLVISKVIEEMKIRFNNVKSKNFLNNAEKDHCYDSKHISDYFVVSYIFSKNLDKISYGITNTFLLCNDECKEDSYICHGLKHGGRWTHQYE